MNPASMFMDDSMMDFGALPDLLLSEDLLQVNNFEPSVAAEDTNTVPAAGNVIDNDKGIVKREFDLADLKNEYYDVTGSNTNNNPVVAVNTLEGASVLATFTYDDLVASNNDAQAMQFLNEVVDANLASPATSTESFSKEEDDETQNLIEEMEDFLSGQEDEGSVPSPVANSTLVEEMEHFLSNAEEDTSEQRPANLVEVTDQAQRSQAENILDALMKGNVAASDCSGFAQDSGLGQSLSETAGISMDNISNISEIVTEDGKKIVIVITNDVANAGALNTGALRPEPAASPASTSGSMSPYHPASPSASSVTESDDGEWCPPGQKVLTKKVATKRKVANTKTTPLAGEPTSKKRGPYKRNGKLILR